MGLYPYPAKSPTQVGWAMTLQRHLGPILFSLVVIFMLISGVMCLTQAIRMIDSPFPGFLVYDYPIVGSFGDYEWPGFQAGVHYRDVILEVNDRQISSGNDIQEVVSQTPVGETLRYLLDRRGERIRLSVAVSVFTFQDFLNIFAIPFLVGISFWMLGIIVYFLKRDTLVTWSFLLFCVFVGTFLVSSFTIQSTRPRWGPYLGILSMSLFPAACLHLSLLFPEKASWVQKRPALQYVPYLLAVFLAVDHLIYFISLTKGNLTSEQTLSLSSQLLTLIHFTRVFALLAAAAILSSSVYVFWRSSSIIARQRARIILLGSAVAFLPPTIGFPLVGITKFVIPFNLLSIPVLVFPLSIGYAIGRHNLFDVDVYIKRALGYVMMTAIVAMVYFSMQTIISTVILTPLLGGNAKKVYPILFALLVVFLFNPVNRRVQDGVDRMFFRKKFDYKETIVSVSNKLASVLNLDEIIKQVIHVVRREMFIDMAGVILLDPQKKGCQTFFIGEGPGNARDQTKDVCIPYDDPLLALLSREKKLITKYDIAEDPRYADVKDPCGQRFSEMAASLAIPLVYQDQVKGVLALGYKKSGHFYTREDIDLLQTLTDEATVAIENARLCEQMRKEVTVRTNLARYLSPQIVDQIIEKDVRVNLGGDRKVVTVLFSDIRNFTSITETRPPDQLVQILNEYFTEMAGIIFENQGSLDKYIGDAIVAVFGSLIPLENSAAHAVTAAIEMMNRLPALNDRWMRDYGFTMHIGIGINTGEVFLGNIGSPERMEFTVIGDAVNVASRLSGVAKPGQILVASSTRKAFGEQLRCNALPPVQVKGKSEPLDVCEVVY